MKKLLLLLLLSTPNLAIAQKECKEITLKKDDLRESITYSSPVLEPVGFIRTIDKDGDHTYISLSSIGHSITYSASGVILLFDDGSKWDKPDAKVDVRVKDLGSYIYSVFIPLDDDDIQLFITKKIVKYGVYLFNTELKEKKAMKYTLYANCINNQNK